MFYCLNIDYIFSIVITIIFLIYIECSLKSSLLLWQTIIILDDNIFVLNLYVYCIILFIEIAHVLTEHALKDYKLILLCLILCYT